MKSRIWFSIKEFLFGDNLRFRNSFSPNYGFLIYGMDVVSFKRILRCDWFYSVNFSKEQYEAVIVTALSFYQRKN